MDTIKNIDQNRQYDITIGEVKDCPLFEHLTEEEASEVIKTLKQFTVIVYNFYKKNKKNPLIKA